MQHPLSTRPQETQQQQSDAVRQCEAVHRLLPTGEALAAVLHELGEDVGAYEASVWSARAPDDRDGALARLLAGGGGGL